jgi:hypothetical protein
MTRRHFLLFSIAIACFCSCGKDNTSPQYSIVGKWNLQQQHVVMYLDKVKITDTILAASSTTYATAQFNQDGTFNSMAVYRPDNTSLLQNPGPSSANTTGSYSYSGGVFTLVPGLAGWFSFGVGSSSPPTGVSSSIQITQLTASKLAVHTEGTFTVTYNNGSHAYDQLFDFYYSK